MQHLSCTTGEYGIVYKGYIINRDGESFDEFLAIKTLKGELRSLALHHQSITAHIM